MAYSMWCGSPDPLAQRRKNPAPKERNSKAQAPSPGVENAGFASPEGAAQVFIHFGKPVPPFRGFPLSCHHPGLGAWALLFRPFRAATGFETAAGEPLHMSRDSRSPLILKTIMHWSSCRSRCRQNLFCRSDVGDFALYWHYEK